MSKRMGRSAQFIGRVKAQGEKVQHGFGFRAGAVARVTRGLDVVVRNADLLRRLDAEMERLAARVARESSESARARLAQRLLEKVRFAVDVELTTLDLITRLPGLARAVDTSVALLPLEDRLHALGALQAHLVDPSRRRAKTRYRALVKAHAAAVDVAPRSSARQHANPARRAR